MSSYSGIQNEKTDVLGQSFHGELQECERENQATHIHLKSGSESYTEVLSCFISQSKSPGQTPS